MVYLNTFLEENKQDSKGPKYNEFSEDFFNQLKDAIDTAVKSVPKPWYAAFDADGTLWGTDIGEIFFKYQVNSGRLKVDLPKDPFEHYLKLKSENPKAAYLWLAQINKGLPLSEVRSMSQNCFCQEVKYPIFRSQRALVKYLILKGVRVFIVSASIKWAVEPGGARFGISQDRVLGVQTRLEEGLVTETQLGPITWKEGKVEALLNETGGVKPILCAGNTIADRELLESSTYIKLAVRDSNSDGALSRSEELLESVAKEAGWFNHRF